MQRTRTEVTAEGAQARQPSEPRPWPPDSYRKSPPTFWSCLPSPALLTACVNKYRTPFSADLATNRNVGTDRILGPTGGESKITSAPWRIAGAVSRLDSESCSPRVEESTELLSLATPAFL